MADISIPGSFGRSNRVPFTPANWFWQADDGRIFSSARVCTVAKGDAALAAFLAGGAVCTTWPRDDAGQQTTASLQDALTPYGLSADLRAYAAAARYGRETGGIAVAGVQVATDEGSQAKIGNAYQLMQASGQASIQFKGTDGTFATLGADQFKTLALAVGAHVQACYAAEAQVDADIAAGKVTTTEQVDAAFAAVTT